MGVPGQIPPGGRGARRAPGHGPFGDKAFKGALVFCGVLVLSAPLLLEPGQIFIGYLVGAIVMILGGIIQATMGVEAAQRDLEDIAPPLSAQEAELEEGGEESDPYTLGRGEERGTAHASRFERDGNGQTTTGSDGGARPTQTGDRR